VYFARHGRTIVILLCGGTKKTQTGDIKAAMESLDNPDDRAAGLLALRTVAEAYGGLGAVAA